MKELRNYNVISKPGKVYVCIVSSGHFSEFWSQYEHSSLVHQPLPLPSRCYYSTFAKDRISHFYTSYVHAFSCYCN